ncbi:hypothetical protein [Fimbriiglobus ruber]|uniref:Uncharacterized protein n=1 Tax=Fimbriiglobus ruber TaxID=1908690 RepID=A0A225DF48_9BACT|nr:hypothetical protein [Fimbriiglobus ruber]OWK35015.1 hypothetical protein FRUB_09857 [Fimbriiglobus ruber]
MRTTTTGFKPCSQTKQCILSVRSRASRSSTFRPGLGAGLAGSGVLWGNRSSTTTKHRRLAGTLSPEGAAAFGWSSAGFSFWPRLVAPTNDATRIAGMMTAHLYRIIVSDGNARSWYHSSVTGSGRGVKPPDVSRGGTAPRCAA